VKEYSIAVLGGDGIGPEVVKEGIKVLREISSLNGLRIRINDYPFGADYYLKTKELFPESALGEMREMDAILLGAVGDPRFETGFLERGIVGKLRYDLDLYINLRPINLYSENLCPLKDKLPKDIDIVVVRENTEDVYFGGAIFFKKNTEDEIAFQSAIYTYKGTKRCIKYAFELASGRKRKKILLVDKANAIQAHSLWRRVFAEVSKEYPDVEASTAFVDTACMWMVKKPSSLDVIVTTNMFGDIITDLGAALQGGLGIAAGGNIHPGRVSMFEPIHGSAPKYKGQNKANPLATICAVKMMLDYLGENKAASKLDEAICSSISSGRIKSVDANSGISTTEVGDIVVSELRKKSK